MNICTFIGRLTRDPELRYTQGNMAVCKSGIAVDVGWGDKKKTMFLDFTVFGKRAEAFQKFHAKGAVCAISGHLELQERTDKATGAKRTKHALAVNDWWFTGGKREQPAATAAPATDSGYGEAPDWLPDDEGAPF